MGEWNRWENLINGGAGNGYKQIIQTIARNKPKNKCPSMTLNEML